MSSHAEPAHEFTGISRVGFDLMTAIGEVGVGLLILFETFVPPVPSEIVLALAGFLASQGTLSVVLVIVAATVGSYVGAAVLYWLGRKLGEERSITLLAKLPLVDREDFVRAAVWLGNHGRGAVFVGRLIPLVRSLISLPAGALRMRFLEFSILTIAGSLIWNTALVLGGYALGSQYELMAEYSDYLNYGLYAAIIAVFAWLVVRAVRRHRADVPEN